ncbi:hypothetical protein QAD02_014564 [Eretmocerus hayati]|uniref:Uncharacterized protein n=1 Tax=Eretmocerus hayati TaxID=131215 RepID=A0ACC2P8K3_9HYME|nr:hypothetical protein QAD02_014564 [Eretmocerus hayati]
MGLLNEADKFRKEGTSNTSEEASDQKTMSRKRYRGAVKYLKKMSKKIDDEHSEKGRKYIDLNRKVSERFGQQKSSSPLETIKEEAAANEAAKEGTQGTKLGSYIFSPEQKRQWRRFCHRRWRRIT